MMNSKAVRGSQNLWELDGDSELQALSIPDPPKAGDATTVRLTLSNGYGPVDDVEICICIGHPANPTAPDDLDAAKDWVKACLVEELVNVDGEEMVRSKDSEHFEDETPWEGTYDAQLVFPGGEHSIEIKVLSPNSEFLKLVVLSDWNVAAR